MIAAHADRSAKKSHMRIIIGITLLVLLTPHSWGESTYDSKIHQLFAPGGYVAPRSGWRPPLIDWRQISEKIKEGQDIQQVVASIPFYFTIRRGPGSGGTGSVVFESDEYGPRICCTFQHDNGIMLQHILWDMKPNKALQTMTMAGTVAAEPLYVPAIVMSDF